MNISNPNFFIVGCPRSGTTMLASLLAKHSRIAVPPETHYFNATIKQMIKNEKVNHREMVEKLYDNLRMNDLNIDYEKFIIFFEENYEASYKDMFQALSEFYASQQNKDIFGEKTPNHLLEVKQILTWYPKAKIILIVRDGRDVVMSLKKVPWIHNDVRRLSYLWKKRVEEGEKILLSYPENCYEIRYEDILKDPEIALKKLLNYLNIDFEKEQLIEKSAMSVMPEWEKKWKKNIEKQITASNKNKWITNASDEDKCIMQFVMGSTLERLQYDNKIEVCRFSFIIKNWFYHFIFNTDIKYILLKIKKLLNPLYQHSITKPKLDVEKHLKDRNRRE